MSARAVQRTGPASPQQPTSCPCACDSTRPASLVSFSARNIMPRSLPRGWSARAQCETPFHADRERAFMVDYNLINSLGNLDTEVNTAVIDALGDAAQDMNLLVRGDEVQDFTPGAIIKGKVSGRAGDDFIVELGLKSEGILERSEFDSPDDVEVGTEVRVLLEDVEGDTGLVKISKRKADRIIN